MCSSQTHIPKVQENNVNQNFDSVLFKELHRILSNGDHLADKRYCFVLKFFNVDSNLYFSLWLQPSFPLIISSQTNLIYVDTNNMFGFNINNYDVIIIDYPNSDGHGLYVKNQINKDRAMLFKKSYEEYIAERGPILSDRKPIYLTYMIKNNKLIQVESIVPPMYKTDKPFEIIIQEKDNDMW